MHKVKKLDINKFKMKLVINPLLIAFISTNQQNVAKVFYNLLLQQC